MKTITQLLKDYRTNIITAKELTAHADFEPIARQVAIEWLEQVARRESSAQMAAEVIFIQDLINRTYTESLVSWVAEQYLQHAEVWISAKLFTMLEMHADNLSDNVCLVDWQEDLKSILRHMYNPESWPLPVHLAECMIML